MKKKIIKKEETKVEKTKVPKENKFKSTWNFIKKKAKDVRKNPKKEFINLINMIREIIKNNVLFSVFVISMLVNTIMLRFFTIHTLENVLFLKPVLSDLTVILLFGAIGFLVKEKNRFFYYMVVAIIMTALCVINSIYYTYYTSFASISLLSTSKYVVAVGDAVVKNVFKIQDFSYLWAILALIIVQIRLKKTKFYKRENRLKKVKAKACTVFGACVVTFLCVLVSVTPTEISRLVKQWNRESLVMNFGIYVYHINDLIKSIEPQLTTLFGYDNAMKTFNEYYQNTSDVQTETNKYTGIFEGKNIITIHAESMQAFAMGLKFNGEEVTPNLNKLASKSLNFTNFYSQVSVGTSSDSEFTLNTSLMPTNNGTAFVSYFDRTYVSIPKLLKEKGYYTFAMHANNGSYWNRNVMHASLGYDKLYSKADYKIDDIIGLGLSDKSFFKQSIEYIKKINAKGKPYYGTMIMLSNHTPFADTDKYGEFPVDIKEEVINEETKEKEIVTHTYMEGTKMGDYFKSLHYADAALGEFLEALETSGLMENTVVVLYGDHDARLPKSDFEKLYNYDITTDDIYEDDDERYKEIDSYQYELLRKVPFMIYSKETEKKLHKNIDTAMGMYNVMPTLGNMFNFYNKYQLGKDIFSCGDDNIVVFPNGNWLTNKVYYNAQKSEYLSLKETIIPEEYIQENDKKTTDILSVSNSLVVFDLIEKSNKNELTNESEITEGITK